MVVGSIPTGPIRLPINNLMNPANTSLKDFVLDQLVDRTALTQWAQQCIAANATKVALFVCYTF